MQYPVPENLLLRAANAKLPLGAGKLVHVTFEAGQQLWRADDTRPHAFFPLRGALSLQLSPDGAKHVEIALVGREGFAGVSLVAGSTRARMSAIAISDGEAFVMSSEMFRRYAAVPAFRAALDRYTQLFVTMVSRILVCNRVHAIEKVCVGRLLFLQDRLKSDLLHMTQDVFAQQLGVRRASISRVVAGLQKTGAISYDKRGRITICDRHHLEAMACTCYYSIKDEYNRLVTQQGGTRARLPKHRK
jgi:CRP-like cAMP-binding protein